MGRVKELMIEEEERGFLNDSKKSVCAKMFPHQNIYVKSLKIPLYMVIAIIAKNTVP